MSYMTTHRIRILPDNTREIWQGKELDDPSHASDITHSGCGAKTWWAPLHEPTLLDAVTGIAGEDPCTCVIVRDRDGHIEAPEIIADMSNGVSGRPFMARFSWTVGLPWEPPIVAAAEEGVVVVRDRETGKKIATAKPGMTIGEAMYEMRMVRY
jgi:hypothetical protein